MAYSLKADTWGGASGSESYPIMQCVMASEDATGTDPDNEVVDVTTGGEVLLLPYETQGTIREVNLGNTWRTTTLNTYKTGYGTPSFRLSGWVIDTPNRYPTFVSDNGLSVFVASLSISAPAGNAAYYTTFSYGGSGYAGIGYNATGNPHIQAFSAPRLTANTAIPLDSSKGSYGMAWSRHDAVGVDSSLWVNVGDGEVTAPGAFDITASVAGNTPTQPYQVGGQGGNGGCPAEHFIQVAFNAMLNAEDFKLLHNSFFSELISAPAPSGAAIPAIIGANPKRVL